jgi:signal transduction histidine kinase
MTRPKRKQDIKGAELNRLQTVLEATKSLNSTLDLAALTDIILQIIRRKVPVERVTAFMVDRASGMLKSVVAQDVGDFVIRLPIGVGIAGFVAQTGETLDVLDVYNDARFYPEIDRQLGFHTRDIFCMPILSGNSEIAGVLQLLNRMRPITDMDRAFLEDISVHIGLALELAWSHRDLLEKQNREANLMAVRERLAEVDSVERVGEVVASVMHELNNPLAILIGNIDLLKMQLEKSDVKSDANRYVEKIEMAAGRSAAAIRKYRHFTETPRRHRKPLDLAQIFRQAAELREFARERSAITVTDELHSVPATMANKEEMQYVFLTLLKQAEEAVLKSERERHIILRCSYDSAAGFIRVGITNTGPGIPLEMQERIFEPLLTLPSSITAAGLGLNVVRRIIESHGGRIWLRSKEGSGTTVSFELPVNREG